MRKIEECFKCCADAWRPQVLVLITWIRHQHQVLSREIIYPN